MRLFQARAMIRFQKNQTISVYSLFDYIDDRPALCAQQCYVLAAESEEGPAPNLPDDADFPVTPVTGGLF